jgi:hypothetical protein
LLRELTKGSLSLLPQQYAFLHIAEYNQIFNYSAHHWSPPPHNTYIMDHKNATYMKINDPVTSKTKIEIKINN